MNDISKNIYNIDIRLFVMLFVCDFHSIIKLPLPMNLNCYFFARYLENKMPKRHLTTWYNKY